MIHRGIAMYNIGICDDEQTFAEELEEMIEQYARETDTELRVTLFQNGSHQNIFFVLPPVTLQPTVQFSFQTRIGYGLDNIIVSNMPGRQTQNSASLCFKMAGS